MNTTIDLRSLQEKPTTIYLAPNVSDITLLKPIMRLFVQQAMDLMLTHFKPQESRHVLFLLDEFRQLGRMDEIVTKLPYVSGYNIKMAFIIQDLKNLDEIYGQNTRESMLGNCGYQLVMGANDETTAKYVSMALGKTTVHYETTSRQIQFMGAHRRSKIQQVRERDLMLPQEVRQMPEDELVILVEGRKPILAKLIYSYRQRPWKRWIAWSKSRVKYPPPNPYPEMAAIPALGEEYGKKYDQETSAEATEAKKRNLAPVAPKNSKNAPTGDYTPSAITRNSSKASVLTELRKNMEARDQEMRVITADVLDRELDTLNASSADTVNNILSAMEL